MSEWKSKANWKDRKWEYVNAASTDITKTIARVKREMKKLAEQEEQEQQEALAKVRQLREHEQIKQTVIKSNGSYR